MPQFDGKGPQGKGPLTGRGEGECEDAKERSDDLPPQRGLGFGRGRGNSVGRGRRGGWRFWRRNTGQQNQQDK